MGKSCCKQCPGSSCCGCCCSKRFATISFAVIGLVLAVGVIIPPVYIYVIDDDFSQLFPAIGISKDFLRKVTDAKYVQEEDEPMVTVDNGGSDVHEVEEDESQTPREKYK